MSHRNDTMDLKPTLSFTTDLVKSTKFTKKTNQLNITNKEANLRVT